MNKKSFIDTIDDETLARMIDKTIRTQNKPKINLLKIIPAVAMIALVIGLMNLLSYIPVFQGGGAGSEGIGAPDFEENIMAVPEADDDEIDENNQDATEAVFDIAQYLYETGEISDISKFYLPNNSTNCPKDDSCSWYREWDNFCPLHDQPAIEIMTRDGSPDGPFVTTLLILTDEEYAIFQSLDDSIDAVLRFAVATGQLSLDEIYD